MEFGLKGKKALITGGSHGIGGAISESLAKEGVSIAIVSRSQSRLLDQKRVLENYNVEVITFECDVLDESQVTHVWRELTSVWGGVDILINNVGGGGRWGTEEIIDTPLETWHEVLQKNYGVTLQLTRLVIPYMEKNKWGRVLTVTSIYGTQIGGRPWFNVAKVAQTTLMKNLSKKENFVRAGITFNSIAPGAIYIPDTGWEEMKRNTPVEYQAFTETLPLGRMGTPREVADLATFICSDKASLVNGASIVIDGGESVSIN
jgi:3-oxoacyl-[acyl-carrier protein] reductase